MKPSEGGVWRPIHARTELVAVNSASLRRRACLGGFSSKMSSVLRHAWTQGTPEKCVLFFWDLQLVKSGWTLFECLRPILYLCSRSVCIPPCGLLFLLRDLDLYIDVCGRRALKITCSPAACPDDSHADSLTIAAPMTNLRACIVLSLICLVEALTPGGLPARSGSRLPKTFHDPHPLRYIHIFGHSRSDA